ncbi:chromosome partitioning protein [Pantoea phage Phynn]|nr:chromosome partitioning protein [Pantoea phage Phynn]
MKTRFEDMRRLAKTTSHPMMLHSMLCWFEGDALDFDAPYQRGYVWTQKEQDEYLTTLLAGYPTGVICVAEEKEGFGIFKETKWIEVVDGKQRLTTLKLFFEGKIGLPLTNGDRIFYTDFTATESRAFRNMGIDILYLSNATIRDKLNFFYHVNFAGVPQSEEHKKTVVEMMK